jgi:hypothetical protein
MAPRAKFNMEDTDAELTPRPVDFTGWSVKSDNPFFLWHNFTRCHVWTRLGPK